MEKPKQIKECECCDMEANCMCFNCNQYFCDNCFKIIHNLAKYKGHKKDIIDAFVPIELKCQKHPTNINSLFCTKEKGKNKTIIIFIIEMCCLMCFYKDLHKGHKLIEIFDEEKIKKENFNVEEEIKAYNDISLKMDEKLNLLFDEAIDHLKKSYQKKYEMLLKEEKDLKENFKIK